MTCLGRARGAPWVAEDRRQVRTHEAAQEVKLRSADHARPRADRSSASTTDAVRGSRVTPLC